MLQPLPSHPAGPIPGNMGHQHVWGHREPGPRSRSPDLLSIEESLWWPLELLPFGKPVFLVEDKGHGWEGEGTRVATSRDPHPPPGPRLTYQAHAGLDAVVIDARDHLQGDGVLAGLHVVHLDRPEVSSLALP